MGSNKEWLLHIDQHKVLPTTIWVAKGKSGRRDRDYLCPSLTSPDRTNLSLSFYHLLFHYLLFSPNISSAPWSVAECLFLTGCRLTSFTSHAYSSVPCPPPSAPAKPRGLGGQNIQCVTRGAGVGRRSYHNLKGDIPFMTITTAKTAHIHLKVAPLNSYCFPIE